VFKALTRRLATDPALAGEREEAKRHLEDVLGTHALAVRRVREIKEDLGRQLSALKTRIKSSRHGRFDRKG